MRWLLLISSAAIFLQVSAGYSSQIPSRADVAPSQAGADVPAPARQQASLDELVADHDWPGLENSLAGNAGPETAFYRGLLLNRRGQYEQSAKTLEALIPGVASGTNREREKQLRLALGEDYLRTFRYREAVEQYAALDRCCAASLTVAERDEAELPAKILPLIENAPAQTLELGGSFTVPLRNNALNVHEVEVWVDGHPSRWLFDPTANFTMLSRSQAARIGLKLTGGDALTVSSIMGEAIRVKATVIPQLKFGAAFFRNVPAVIYEDADLFDKTHQYQIEGVLAQPLLAALGAVSVSDDGHLNVLDQPPLTGGAPLFSDGRLLLAEAGAQRLYVIDPGRAASMLNSRYSDTHAAEAATAAETITLDFGGVAAVFHEIPVAAKAPATEEDHFAGRLGGDALDQLASYTFDFRSMRFLVREHAEQ
jgi:hypothetical protein